MIPSTTKSIVNCLTAMLFLMLGGLQACQQIAQIQSAPVTTTSRKEVVPTSLLTTARLDSTIILNEAVDFSGIAPAGQGPKGSLLFWGNRDSPGRWSSYTYDSQGRLVGIYRSDYARREQELARYRDGYLAEDYIQEVGGRLHTLKHYRYDVQGYKRQTLIYTSSNDQPGVFRLHTRLDHAYDDQGQLLTIRQQSRDLPDSYWLHHWKGADCVRKEQYTRDPDTKGYDLRERTTLWYTSQPDPVYALPLHDEYTTQPSQHIVGGTTQYTVFRGAETAMPGCVLTNQFVHDAQGRLTQLRATTGNLWDYYTYVP